VNTCIDWRESIDNLKSLWEDDDCYHEWKAGEEARAARWSVRSSEKLGKSSLITYAMVAPIIRRRTSLVGKIGSIFHIDSRLVKSHSQAMKATKVSDERVRRTIMMGLFQANVLPPSSRGNTIKMHAPRDSRTPGQST
jgi:hypothetical protein